MSIRMLALALLAAFSLAHAAPPQSKEPQDPASTGQSAESIDVDAIARAKDVNGATPANADTPPAQAETASAAAPAAVAPADATPPEAPPADAAPSEAPPPAAAETTRPSEASAPETPATNAQAPSPDAAAAAPPAGSKSQSAADSETTEKISIAASCQARATSLLDDAQKGDFVGASSAFDAKMRTAMPPPKLKQAWDQLAQFGKLAARGQSHLGSGEGYTIVMVPLIFEKANLVAQIACGTDGRIAGFYVKPIPTPTPTQTPTPTPTPSS